MTDQPQHVSTREDLRFRIIKNARNLFYKQGIKAVTMDEIASSLSISKRTLYEIFSDKEALLEACVYYNQELRDQILNAILAESKTVLEVILKVYMHTMEMFHNINPKFYDDINRYPKVVGLIDKKRKEESADTIRFFKQGIQQGVFREDVNFDIIHLLLVRWINMPLYTDICKEYSIIDVYESIMFTFLRGISTARGVREIEDFIQKYRKDKSSVKF